MEIKKQIEDNVNSFCSCGFKFHYTNISCFDDFSITLRGSSDSDLVGYLKDWVSTKSTTVKVQGISLIVDKNCVVPIASLDAPGCTGGVTNAQGSSASSNTSVAVGAAIGVSILVIIAIIFLVLIAVVRRWKGKKNTVVRYEMNHYTYQ